MSKSTKKAPAKRPAKKQETALAVRKPAPVQTLRIQVNDPERLLPAKQLVEEIHLGVLSEEASTGDLGLVEVKLTEAEELVLSEPVSMDDVSVKPTGQPYLSHPVYTKWFNRSFGRLGWSIVPKAKATKADTINGALVVVPYMLYIHGKPVAFAQGEHEYNPKNREQTFGDAIESTVASALRRCAKRLGVGLELWDKRWLHTFLTTRCVRVKVKGYKGAEDKWLWRLKDAPALPFEIGSSPTFERVYADDRPLHDEPPHHDEPQPRQAPSAGTTDMDDEKITQAMRQRLATIARKAGRPDAEVSLFLKKVWKVSSSKDLKRRDYDAVCRQLEAKGPLPLPGDGE